MQANQEMLKVQITKYSDQMQRLVHSDTLVKQLCAENETLVMAIQTLEDSIRIDVENADSCLSADDFKKASQECLDAVQHALLNTVYEEPEMESSEDSESSA